MCVIFNVYKNCGLVGKVGKKVSVCVCMRVCMCEQKKRERNWRRRECSLVSFNFLVIL